MNHRSSLPRSKSALLLLSLAAGLISGCQSVIDPPRTAVELAKAQIGAIHGVSQSVSSLEQAVTKDPDASAKRIQALEARIADSEARVKQVAEEANTKNEKLKQRVVDAAGDLAQVASAFTGLGPIVPGLLSSVKAGLEGAAAKAGTDAAAAAEKQIAALKSELQARDELRKKETELARQELANLSAQQQADLRRELIAEAKQRGIEGADGMSLEELLAALGSGGLSIAALVRTFGRSRSQDEIDRLRDKQQELQMQVAQTSAASATQKTA